MLYIRHITVDDFDALCRLIDANKDRLKDSFPVTVKAFATTETARDFLNIRISKALQKNAYYFLIFLKTSDEPIGIVSIKDIDYTIPKAELAYFVDGRYEGKSIITQALAWLVKYAFDEAGLERVYVRVHPDNEGSKKVALKNGFTYEGVLRNDSRDGSGRLCDAEYYGLVKGNEK